jgi:cyclophilin family peptidyl-prolyl cis-trans isomerase
MENNNNNNNNNNTFYIKTDDNKIINEKHIRWVQKMGDCLEVCAKVTGCHVKHGDTIRICKLNNPDSYNKLNKYFE